MTSGIRSNWMKAIRLCMDLQNSNKNKPPSPSADSSVASRTNDDMEIETAAASRLSQNPETSKPPEKKEYARNVRRHYSDVNPGNIGKMFSVKGLTLDSKGLSHSLSSQASTSSGSNSAASSKEPSVERESRTEQRTSPPRTEIAAIPKQGKYSAPQHTWSSDGIPFRRFVEGSDSHVTPPPVTAEITKSSSDLKEDDEKKRRNKSPSVRIKEKSRAKSPKLHSPPPGQELDEKFTFRPTISSDHMEEDNISVSSGDMDIVDGDHDHNIVSEFPATAVLTHFCLVDPSILTNWTSPFPIFILFGINIPVSKQWRPWLDTAFCGVWSRSVLFAWKMGCYANMG